MEWWEMVLRILLAVSIGCIIGAEREHKRRPAGIRTHMLVCVGAATIALLESMLTADTASMNISEVAVSRGRLSAQVISGIGFLGAGTIFMSKKKITGLTTAASLWNVACLGLAAGMGYYALAVVGCATVMVILTLVQRLYRSTVVRQVEVQFTNRGTTLEYISQCFSENNIHVIDIDVHVKKGKGNDRLYTNLYTVSMPAKVDYADVLMRLANWQYIESIRTLSPD